MIVIEQQREKYRLKRDINKFTEVHRRRERESEREKRDNERVTKRDSNNNKRIKLDSVRDKERVTEIVIVRK